MGAKSKLSNVQYLRVHYNRIVAVAFTLSSESEDFEGECGVHFDVY